MSKVVEVMARAIDPDKFTFWQSSYDYEMGKSGDALEATGFADWCHNIETVRQQAQAALAALDTAGFVVVPKEPTDEMLEASVSRDDWLTEAHVAVLKAGFGAKYRAMLAASQVTP